MDPIDLVALQGGRPLVAVEAKSRPVPDDFRGPVLEQLREGLEATQSRWAVLAAPDRVEFYRHDDLEQPRASIPSEEILRAAGLEDSPVVGEALLTTAMERWLQRLRSDHAFGARYPALKDFFELARRADDVVRDFHA